MTRQALAAGISQLADAVLADWRWVRDDLSVSVLGMILYGFATATAREMGHTTADVDAAVLQCLTERVGAAAKWSGGLVAEAAASARDKAYHPGQHELIGVGQTYRGVADQRALVDNVFANFASVRRRAGLPEPVVTVFMNPLVMLLAARERQKGSRPASRPSGHRGGGAAAPRHARRGRVPGSAAFRRGSVLPLG